MKQISQEHYKEVLDYIKYNPDRWVNQCADYIDLIGADREMRHSMDCLNEWMENFSFTAGVNV